MVLLCSVAARGHVSFAQAQPNAVLTDGVAQLLLKIEAAVGAGSASDFLALSSLDPDRLAVADFGHEVPFDHIVVQHEVVSAIQ